MNKIFFIIVFTIIALSLTNCKDPHHQPSHAHETHFNEEPAGEVEAHPEENPEENAEPEGEVEPADEVGY